MPATRVGNPKAAAERADSALECAISEAQVELPLYNGLNGALIGWITEDDARILIKKRRATLIRDKSGRLRRVYLAVNETDDPRQWKGSVVTDASRTVRKQHLQDTHWTY